MPTTRRRIYWRHLRLSSFLALTTAGLLRVLGCSLASSGSGFPAGDFGATQGGAQDMGLARQLIDNGRVPPEEAFVVEGMFSEHELGLTGDACERTLCLREAMGIAPALDGSPRGWLQVGLSSTIDMDTFVRDDLLVIACIDVSGSMGWEYTTEQNEFPTPGQVTRNLLSAIAAKLNADDQIAVVTYGSTVNTVLPVTTGDKQQTIQAVIDSLSTGGVTDMEGGLIRAYDIAREAAADGKQVRVMLFTDIQPNVGATTATEFEQIVEGGAADGIGLTVFGVGVGMGQELFTAMSHLRGGNAFSLFDNEDVGELMDDDWPWLVSPIAYNLSLDLTPSDGFTGSDAYGFPAGEEGEGPSLEAATVFLSRRKGALLVSFAPQAGEALTDLQVSGTLEYDTPEGEQVTQDVDVSLAGAVVDENGQYFEQESVHASVALALLVSGMQEAAKKYATDEAAAIESLQTTINRYSSDIESMDDASMTTELELANKLLTLMQQGAEQGDLYGYGQQF